MIAPTLATRTANLARSAASPLGPAHYADAVDELGPHRVLCECEVGAAHDADDVPQPLTFPDRLDRAYPIKPKTGVRDE